MNSEIEKVKGYIAQQGLCEQETITLVRRYKFREGI